MGPEVPSWISLFSANTKHFITLVQRRTNVFDVGPTLYKCYKNVLCSHGYAVKTFNIAYAGYQSEGDSPSGECPSIKRAMALYPHCVI